MTKNTDKHWSVDDSNEGVLKRFMEEFFPYSQFKKIGFFTKEMKGNYIKQAEKVCHFFGYKTVYEYGKDELRCHISFDEGERFSVNDKGEMEQKPFITIIPSIY